MFANVIKTNGIVMVAFVLLFNSDREMIRIYST